MATDEQQVRQAIAGLAPRGKRGPHSQFVKGYNRAIRDALKALGQVADRSGNPTTTPSRR